MWEKKNYPQELNKDIKDEKFSLVLYVVHDKNDKCLFSFFDMFKPTIERTTSLFFPLKELNGDPPFNKILEEIFSH